MKPFTGFIGAVTGDSYGEWANEVTFSAGPLKFRWSGLREQLGLKMGTWLVSLDGTEPGFNDYADGAMITCPEKTCYEVAEGLGRVIMKMARDIQVSE